MENLLSGMLGAHIVAGTLALLTGPVAMLTLKGGRNHRLWGKVYFYSMVVVFLTAVVLSVFKDIPFLLMIAFLSIYLVVSGYRALYLKKLHAGQKAAIGDWIFLIVSLAGCMALVGWGVYRIFVLSSNFGIVGIALGLLGCRLVYKDIKKFVVPPKDKDHWLFSHVSGMGGGYIATFTAFAVVNITFLPGPVIWILPAVIGGTLIARWAREHRKGKTRAVVTQVTESNSQQ
jgi:uncharacterized membrane protein